VVGTAGCPSSSSDDSNSGDGERDRGVTRMSGSVKLTAFRQFRQSVCIERIDTPYLASFFLRDLKPYGVGPCSADSTHRMPTSNL
jgi:hypothetical protein